MLNYDIVICNTFFIIGGLPQNPLLSPAVARSPFTAGTVPGIGTPNFGIGLPNFGIGSPNFGIGTPNFSALAPTLAALAPSAIRPYCAPPLLALPNTLAAPPVLQAAPIVRDLGQSDIFCV
jgi:hypothetical protein